MLSPQAALIQAMLVAAQADHAIAAAEIDLIGDLVDHLPIFRDVDRGKVTELAAACSAQLARPGGLDQVYAGIREALSPPRREAAYALSCDVIAAGCRPQHDQVRALERIRARLEVDPASARTIERAARVRSRAA